MTLNAVSHDGDHVTSAAASSPPIPSWVPRWHVRGPYSVIGYPGRFNASGGRGHELTFLSQFQCLVVKGARIDTIERTLPSKFQMTTPNTFSSSQIYDAWCLCLGQGRKSKPWLLKFGGESRYGPDDATSSLEAFLDTFAPKEAISELAASTPSFQSGLRALENIFPAKRNEIRAIPVPDSVSKPSSGMDAGGRGPRHRKKARRHQKGLLRDGAPECD